MAKLEKLPPFRSLAKVANSIAMQAAAVSNLPYKGQALREIEEFDEAYSYGVVLNPVKFCHEVAGIYLQGAGDFLYGATLRANPRFNLAFSSAALARGACEFSAWSWWTQDPALNSTERVGRAMGILRNDVNHPGNVGDLGVSGEELVKQIDKWVEMQPFKVPKGSAKITDILDKMNHGVGAAQYKYLSGITHGRLTPILRVHHAVRNSPADMQDDHWMRLLIASQSVMKAMLAISTMRDSRIDRLDSLRAKLDSYTQLFEWTRAADPAPAES